MAQLNGAGSTFIFPLLSQWGGQYDNLCRVKLNYQSIGSGGGVKAWTDNTVDFGASDAYLADTEVAAAAKNGEPVEIPVTFGAVVIAYNLKGLSAPIKMTPDIIANIFLGTITKWNDPAIVAENSGLTLPATDISVVHRSDGSGTTSIFTKYLTAVSPAWVAKVGAGDPKKSAGKTVEWPVGLGASGNEGVTQGINQTDGGVGYIELAYALKNKIPFATVKNSSGNYVVPSLDCGKGRGGPAIVSSRPALRSRQHRRPAGLPDLRNDLAHRVQGSVEDDEEPGSGEVIGRLPLVVDPRWAGRLAGALLRSDPCRPARPGRGRGQVHQLGRAAAPALTHPFRRNVPPRPPRPGR